MQNLTHDLTGLTVALVGVVTLVITLTEILSHPTANGWTDWMNEDRWRHL